MIDHICLRTTKRIKFNKMINLNKFKDLLGEEGKNLSEEEIELLKEAQYKLSKVVFDKWVKDKKIKANRPS